MAGLTLTNGTRSLYGNTKLLTGTLTFDSSYPTGGELISASFFSDFDTLQLLLPSAHTSVATKYARWDRANGKLMIFIEDGTSGIEAEAGSTSDQSAVTVEFLAVGL